MELLKGKSILVGREPDKARLLVSVMINGEYKTAFTGGAGTVPQCVSRSYAGQNKGHCRIDVDASGQMTLVNVNPSNFTFVDGVGIQTKHITEKSAITLGSEHYALNIGDVIDVAKKIVSKVAPPPKPEFSIAHLEKVWEDYHSWELQEQKTQRRNNAIASCGGIFSLLAIVVSFVGVSDGVRYTLYGCAIVVAVFSIAVRFLDRSIEKREAKKGEFQRYYVCPNPECRHFLGYIDFSILRQNKGCGYCRCKYKQK